MKHRLKILLILIYTSVCFSLFAQTTNYSMLAQEALECMWQSKDTVGYRKSLDIYEKAFSFFPDSIDEVGLYKASVLSAELKEYDKAFKFLAMLMNLEDKYMLVPKWQYIVGEASEEEFVNLFSDARWKELNDEAQRDKRIFFDRLREREKEFYAADTSDLREIKSPVSLYEAIKQRDGYLFKQERDYSISFAVNDSVKTSFFVHLPLNYDPRKSYPLLFFLHGAVRSNRLSEYQTASECLYDWNRFYTKYAALNNVILVFPKGSKQFNWMMPDDGFFMIPKILVLVKKAVNVDDDRVFVSGHSNGATGSFSYLMKQPTPFAGFYGFNTYPKVFTGGTFAENIKNRSFVNFSTDEDYYYPPNANDDFSRLMRQINADYKEYRYTGFPHWFPQFDESEQAYQILFTDLVGRKRNPFPKKIVWEFDDERYGSVDWISNIRLDTLTERKEWHRDLNFRINRWLEYNDNDALQVVNVDKTAFDFPRQSGKIVAKYEDNVFRIQTSCIKGLAINISPEMIDMKKKVRVYVNGKLYFNKLVEYNTDFMRKNFEANLDRSQVWVNRIEIQKL